MLVRLKGRGMMHAARLSEVPMLIQLQQVHVSILDCCKVVLQFANASVNFLEQVMY